MNYKKYIFLFFLFLCSLAIADQNAGLRVLACEIPIKVLLTQADSYKDISWVFENKSGFEVIFPDKKNRQAYEEKKITVTADRRTFLLNDQAIKQEKLFILPRSDVTRVNGQDYYGAFIIQRDGDGLYLINYIDLEDYVLSVISTESWPGWPDEVNRASAICFRSYGIHKVLEQRARAARKRTQRPYDIKNTNAHQVYKGCFHGEKFKDVVEATRGVVLSYNDKPILAMFDSCCGGIIPALKKGVDFVGSPYLKRTYPCTYCYNSHGYSWEKSFTLSELEELFKKEFSRFGRLRDVKVYDVDLANVVHGLRIRTSTGWFNLPEKKLTLLKGLKSCAFVIESLGQKLVFKGHGIGHHLGLCQWGARQMVREGWGYKEVLSFYYPQTKLMRLQVKKQEP